MAWEWLRRLGESEEDRKARQFRDFSETEDFRKMLREEAASIVAESREEDRKAKEREKEEHIRKVEQAKQNISVIAEDMKESNEPFVNVLSMGFTPENGIEVSLDYNQAFIRYLNNAGIKASNDEETIRLWLAHLNYDISEEAKAQDYLMNGVSEDEMPSMSFEEMFGANDEDDDEDEPDSRWEQPTS